MLIEFTVGNYLSFKEKKTLILEATPITEYPENVFTEGKYKLLRSAAIYGANSSGKSNLLKAFGAMANILRTSANQSSADEIDVTPFLLSDDTENKPSFFEVLFIIEGIRYRYGFEADKEKIHAEWLFQCKKNQEKELFIREDNAIDLSKNFEEGQGLEEKTRDNALFLSVVDQFNGILASKIIFWFNWITPISSLKHEDERIITSLLMRNDDNLKSKLEKIINQLNLGFENYNIKKVDEDTYEIFTLHNRYNDDGKIIGQQELRAKERESSGTNKIFDIIGLVAGSLTSGGVVVVDGLDAKLHPSLTKALIKLFNSPEHNPLNAQLIFATHDTNLLSDGGLRRDQIYFTEKDHTEATDLYSLVEYQIDDKKVRKDSSFEKDYIAGLYGAIPFIGDFSNILNNGTKEED